MSAKGEESDMQTVDAVYEHGVFRPRKPVELREGEEVELTISPRRTSRRTTVRDSEFTAHASEEALSQIWNDPAEDEAWAHLEKVTPS